MADSTAIRVNVQIDESALHKALDMVERIFTTSCGDLASMAGEMIGDSIESAFGSTGTIEDFASSLFSAENASRIAEEGMRLLDEGIQAFSEMANDAQLKLGELTVNGLPLLEQFAAVGGECFERIQGVVGNAMDEFDTFKEGIAECVVEGKAIFNELADAATEVCGVANGAFTEIREYISGETSEAAQAIQAAWGDAVVAFDTLQDSIDTTKDAFGIIQDTVETTITDAKGHCQTFKDSLQAAAVNGDIKGMVDSITTFGSSMKETLTNSFQTVKEQVGRIKDAFVNTIETAGKLKDSFAAAMSAVKKLTESEKLMEIGTRVLTSVKTAWGTITSILTSKINLQNIATAAAAVGQKALNLVMNLCPAMLVATMVIALIAALAKFLGKSKESTEQSEEMNDSLEDVGDTAQNTGEALDELTDQSKDMNDSLTEMSDTAQDTGEALDEIGDAAGDMGENMADAANKVTDVEHALGGFGEAGSTFLDNISDMQGGISDLVETFGLSAEREKEIGEAISDIHTAITDTYRSYLDDNTELQAEEYESLQEHVDNLEALHQEKIDNKHEEFKNQVETGILMAEQMAQMEDMTLEQYQAYAEKHIGAAQQKAEEEKDLIYQQTDEMRDALALQFKMDESMTEEDFRRQMAALDANQAEKLVAVEGGLADVTSAYLTGYEQVAENQGVSLGKMSDTLAKYNSETQKEVAAHDVKLALLKKVHGDNSEAYQNAAETAEQKHQENMQKIQEQMMKDMDTQMTESEGVWLALVTQTEQYGGKVSDKTQEMADGMIEALDGLPEDMQSVAGQAMQGMLDGMHSMEGTLYSKADDIGNNIAARLRKALDVHSPSRVTRGIFQFVMQGAELGLEDEEASLYKQVVGIGKNVLRNFKDGTKNAAAGIVERLQGAMAFNNHALMPAMAGGYATGGTTIIDNHTELEQTITSPTPLSPAQVTREAESLLRRAKWQNP